MKGGLFTWMMVISIICGDPEVTFFFLILVGLFGEYKDNES